MLEYIVGVPASTSLVSARRWELYRLLSEPVRLRLLALASVEELAIGELAELLDESQPNVSRHAKALRASGLLTARRQGRWAFLRLTDGVGTDAVIGDALLAGRSLCDEDGSLARVARVVAARDAAAREFFSRPDKAEAGLRLPVELPAYLSALAPLIPRRDLAVDAGTGDGALLDMLAPIFGSVIAIDRSEPQLERAQRRCAARGYTQVELIATELEAPGLLERVHGLGGADAVFASRMLHHAPKPVDALRSLAALARPGGAVVVIDYETHGDERLLEQQADLWLGFDAVELVDLAARSGLVDARVTPIPSARCGDGPDGHLDWQVLVARTTDHSMES